jgi:hypothetical protein
MNTKEQVCSVCAQLIHAGNQVVDSEVKNEISSSVAQLIHTSNKIE